MFGYKKGVFIDVIVDCMGCFEMVNKGIIFLDEIGDFDLLCQVKLLWVLQDQIFEVLGDSCLCKMDIWVVLVMNVDLSKMVSEYIFCEDLFYCINLIIVKLFVLRECREDILLFVRYFVDCQVEINNLFCIEFLLDVLNFLSCLFFLGNICELKNLVECMILVSGKEVLDVIDFEN